MKRLLPRNAMASLCLALALAGCGALTLPPLQPKAVDSYSQKQEHNGLAVAIEPMTNSRAARESFGADLLDSDILAILVVSENRSPSTSYILAKDRFSLSLGAAEIGAGSPASPVSDSAGTAVAVTAVAIGAPILLGIGAKMAMDATVIKHNLKAKELQVNTLSPGKGTAGFVYFQLPRGTRLPVKCSIRLDAIDLQSRGTLRFEFAFELSGS